MGTYADPIEERIDTPSTRTGIVEIVTADQRFVGDWDAYSAVIDCSVDTIGRLV